MLNFKNFSHSVKQIGRSLVPVLIVIVLSFAGFAPAQAAPRFSSDRGSDVTRASDTTYKGRNIIQADSKTADPATAKVAEKIKREAEDLGDSPNRPIGETGLKNIRKLGENIPETAKLKAKQTKDIYTSDSNSNPLEKNPLEKVKDKIEDVVDSLK